MRNVEVVIWAMSLSDPCTASDLAVRNSLPVVKSEALDLVHALDVWASLGSEGE